VAGPWFLFVLAVLACWRITHLLAREDGPADVVLLLRRRLGSGGLGRAMDCFKCLSLWVAAPLAVGVFAAWGVGTIVLGWLGLSAGACLLERLAEGTSQTFEQPVVVQTLASHNQGESHVMLRTEALGAGRPGLNGGSPNGSAPADKAGDTPPVTREPN